MKGLVGSDFLRERSGGKRDRRVEVRSERVGRDLVLELVEEDERRTRRRKPKEEGVEAQRSETKRKVSLERERDGKGE